MGGIYQISQNLDPQSPTFQAVGDRIKQIKNMQAELLQQMTPSERIQVDPDGHLMRSLTASENGVLSDARVEGLMQIRNTAGSLQTMLSNLEPESPTYMALTNRLEILKQNESKLVSILTPEERAKADQATQNLTLERLGQQLKVAVSNSTEQPFQASSRPEDIQTPSFKHLATSGLVRSPEELKKELAESLLKKAQFPPNSQEAQGIQERIDGLRKELGEATPKGKVGNYSAFNPDGTEKTNKEKIASLVEATQGADPKSTTYSLLKRQEFKLRLEDQESLLNRLSPNSPQRAEVEKQIAQLRTDLGASNSRFG
jgi:hypothetical protein